MFCFPVLLEVLVITERVEAFRAFDLRPREKNELQREVNTRDERKNLP